MNPRLRPSPPALPFPEPVRPASVLRGPRAQEPWDHCPTCGERLVAVRSHVRCLCCGYFMAGSEFERSVQ